MKRWIIVIGGVVIVAAAITAVSIMSGVEKSGAATANVSTATTPPTAAPSTNPANETLVEIDNFVFKPKQLTVTVGAKVTWVNKDDVPHTASSTDDTPAFDSKTLDTDDKYSFTFTKPGTYKYFCKVHPYMTGVVIVK